ncbi:DUF4157 domain-containing protein [Streptomyces luteolifulvus]|uniref:DUF4157 domain-containing protein n=1 Tax=Streptomyces luteolifulvus TaxID=2615112 RepID=A0A6H9V9Q8_9ACTN|nr:DUF4157 domain-containing protein [Streptomyces luteolifulvus]KAB1150551.1 DUF4157 domain-containing protein [Streptomyces luteolifulvus]
MNSQNQEARSEQAAEQRRRRRKERAANSRTPEPKNIVSGAGQPLDPGVRRELEEQLGHDLGRVRLHTGRDAGQLTELLGADAVAVGQDVFFREGAFMPGTDEGRRLLAHELLHTVQNPHGLGALRAGRELGAVSLPQQAVEREAESAAQNLVRAEPAADQKAAPQVEEGQATPGWLRYATVDADRNRMEAIDPATLVDRLANSVVRSLRGDPEDLSQRTRKQLARLPDELLDGVLARLEHRLLGSEHDRVLDMVDEIEAYDDFADDGLERDALEAPRIEPDTAEQLRTERENERCDAEERRTQEQRPGAAPGPEKERAVEEGAPGSTPRNGGPAERRADLAGAQQGRSSAAGPSSSASASQAPATSPSSGGPAGAPAPAPAAGEKADAGQQGGTQQATGSESGKGEKGEQGEPGEKGSKEQKGGEEKGGKEARERQETPAASKEESAARNRAGAAEAAVAGRQLKQEDRRGQEKPKGSPAASGKDTQLPGAFSTLDGARNQDLGGPEEETDEDPFGSGSESEVEVGGGEPSAWDTKLQPEDFLPQHDLDVSAVPTADQLDPSSSATPAVPSFPAPPPTRAEKVQVEREAEDAEDAAAEAEPEEDTSDEAAEPESSAPETEGGPASSTGLSGPALEQTTAGPPASTSASRDPKSGDDPKAGPVAAQTTVQEAPGKAEAKSEGGSAAKETAAKEEKGTDAAGDKASAAPERESQQATAGRAAQSETGAKETASGTGASADAQSSSPAGQDMPTGGSGGPVAPAPSAGSGSGSSSGAGGGAQESPAEPSGRTAAPAPRSAPAPQEQASAPASKAAAPETAPEPTAASAPTARSASHGGGGGRGAGGGGGRGAGGGGGGGRASGPAARGKKDSAPAPNLTGVSPEAGLATASKLKPHKALQAMGGVSGAVDRTVGDEHKTLAAAPPAMQRPAGAPQTLQGRPRTDAPAQYAQDPAQQAQEPEREDAKVTGEKQPEGQIEAEKAEEPGGWDTFKMALGFGIGKVASWLGFEVDAQELAAKFAGLPTKDEALKQAQAGNAPGVQMKGAAEQTTGEQDGHVDAKGQETVQTGRDDAGRGMGEDQVYPNAPKEQLTAEVPGQQGGGQGVAAEGGATGAVPPEAASEVAEHERGPQFQAAFSDGQKGVSEGRQAKDRDFRDAQAKHKRKVDAEIATNTESQAGEREKAMGEVTAQREGWRAEQDEELKSLGDKKTERHDKVRKDVDDEEKKTDDNVEKEKGDSDKKIKDESDKAERDAEQKRDASVQESGNWVSKAFDWIKQKVIEIKNAIVRVIRAAREAVVGFIRTFKQTVERWINDARKNIVEAIKNFIKDLIEFALAMVRAVIELANRIRKFITDLIAAAIALVNRLAQALKQAITDLLNAIGRLLSSILDVLKKALLAALKAVVEAVKAVLEFASKLLSALGAWMLIAVDFLSDPGGWLGGAKNSAVDGAKNHLFREVSSAVKAWFQEKIQEIIGVPKAIIDKLIKGGYSLDKIVKEAWDAVVPQLPLIIGELVLTKVVAKLIPGAGWVMAVIDAIRTAWGALSAILRSLGAVLAWLKAVRMGGAGILFAKAVAAGVVALLEVLYQALLSGIGKYVAKVGRRLKNVAAKLGGKGKGGGGRGPGADGSDDKGGRRDGARSEHQTASDRPSAKSPARPAPTAQGAGRPRPTGPSAGRPPSGPGRQDGRGRPQPDRPASRPTEPATPRTRPRPDRDTPTKPRDDRPTPDRPRDKDRPRRDQDSERPRDNDRPQDGSRPDRDPNRPKDERPTRPKDDKDGPNRPKDAKSGDGRQPKDGDESSPRKPKKPKDGDGKKPKDRDPKRKGPKDKHPDKDRDPHKEKQDKKDQRKKDEDSKDSKDARLQKIIARIRPKIGGMLRRSVHERVFDGALKGMRTWYRLTSLARHGSPAFEVAATLNPTGKAEDGYQLSGAELRVLVREVTNEVLDRDDVVAAAREMRREKHEAQSADDRSGIDEPLRINGGPHIPAAVRYLRERGEQLDVSRPGEDPVLADPYDVSWGKMELYDIGENEERVKEQQKTGVTNLVTQGIGKYQHLTEGKKKESSTASGRKPEDSLKSVGLSGPRFAAGLRSYILEGKAPEGFTEDQARLVRNAHWLMFVRESHRNPTNLAYAAMTADLLAYGPDRGGLTPHQAFAEHEGKRLGGRGRFPMSMVGAAPAAQGIEQEEVEGQTKGLKGSKAQREELKQREGELAERWLLARMKLDGIEFDNKEDATEKARNLIREFLLRFYGLE